MFENIREALKKNFRWQTEYGGGPSVLGGLATGRVLKHRDVTAAGDAVESMIYERDLALGPIRFIHRSGDINPFSEAEAEAGLSLLGLVIWSNQDDFEIMANLGPDLGVLRNLAMIVTPADVKLTARAGFRLNISRFIKDLRGTGEKEPVPVAVEVVEEEPKAAAQPAPEPVAEPEPVQAIEPETTQAPEPEQAPTPEIKIIDAGPEDFKTIEALHIEWNENSPYKPYVPWIYRRRQICLWELKELNLSSRGYIFKAVDGDRMVGFITAKVTGPDSIHIEDAYVSLDYRKLRIGSALFDKVKETAQGLGIKKVTVGIATTNTTAMAFWTGMGFAKPDPRSHHELMI